ncbi:MAG: hypothetical protein ACLFVK_02200 [Dehalococcoidia bacterium]
MKAFIVLSLIWLITGFIIALLGAFPLNTTASSVSLGSTNDTFYSGSANDTSYPGSANNTAYVQARAEEAGELFTSSYEAVVNDLMSFQNNPSLQKAEARRDTFTAYGQTAVKSFETLAKGLRDKLDNLTKPFE